MELVLNWWKFATEKYKEELFINNNFNRTEIKNIFTVQEDIDNEKQFLKDINNININFNKISELKIKKFFQTYVENYKYKLKNK